MAELAGWYAGMAGMTALWLFFDVRPRRAGEWFALAGISALWPLAFTWAAYWAFRCLR